MKGNVYLGKADKCLTNSWANMTYNCPEFVNYSPSGFSLNMSAAESLVDHERLINLDDEVVATLVTAYVLQNEKLDTLNSLYNMDNFGLFFAGMRNMVQTYLLGGSIISQTYKDYIFGYNDAKIQHLFEEKDIFQGRELFLDPFVSSIFNEKSQAIETQSIGIFTGAINLNNVC